MNAKHWWKCVDCGSKHSGYTDAMTCCSPSPDEVFCCDTCFCDFDSEEDAELCCVAVDEENEPIITAEMLEAAGQLRLPLPEVAP